MRRHKYLLVSLALVLVLALNTLFVPVIEVNSYYCFYCTRGLDRVEILGIQVWTSTWTNPMRDDGVTVPYHEHKMVGLCGSRAWLLSPYTASYDEFGFTGHGCRDVLVNAIKATPEKSDAIFRDYLNTDPWDDYSREVFMHKYGQTDE